MRERRGEKRRTDDHEGELNTLLDFVSSASACERHFGGEEASKDEEKLVQVFKAPIDQRHRRAYLQAFPRYMSLVLRRARPFHSFTPCAARQPTVTKKPFSELPKRPAAPFLQPDATPTADNGMVPKRRRKSLMTTNESVAQGTDIHRVVISC